MNLAQTQDFFCQGQPAEPVQGGVQESKEQSRKKRIWNISAKIDVD